jgi:hypothetical protein
MDEWQKGPETTGGMPRNVTIENPVPPTEEEEKPNGLKRMWNRRFKSVMIWLLTCVGLIASVRYLQFDKELVKLMIDKSTWVLGLLIIGLSGTDLMRDWIQKYK